MGLLLSGERRPGGIELLHAPAVAPVQICRCARPRPVTRPFDLPPSPPQVFYGITTDRAVSKASWECLRDPEGSDEGAGGGEGGLETIDPSVRGWRTSSHTDLCTFFPSVLRFDVPDKSKYWAKMGGGLPVRGPVTRAKVGGATGKSDVG